MFLLSIEKISLRTHARVRVRNWTESIEWCVFCILSAILSDDFWRFFERTPDTFSSGWKVPRTLALYSCCSALLLVVSATFHAIGTRWFRKTVERVAFSMIKTRGIKTRLIDSLSLFKLLIKLLFFSFYKSKRRVRNTKFRHLKETWEFMYWIQSARFLN